MNRYFIATIAVAMAIANAFGQKSEGFKATTAEVQTAGWAQDWWGQRHVEKMMALKEQKEIDLLFIGDSITHGFEEIGKAVWEKHYAPRNAFNIGFSGDRTENVLWRLENGAITGISPKLAVIMIGTNNTGHRKEEPIHTAAGIGAILGELREQLPNTKLLLLAIFPRDPKPDGAMRKLNDATNMLIEKFADNENVFYLDIGQTFLTDDGELTKEIMPDFLHPNEKGYELWAEAMEAKIKELMAVGEDASSKTE